MDVGVVFILCLLSILSNLADLDATQGMISAKCWTKTYYAPHVHRMLLDPIPSNG